MSNYVIAADQLDAKLEKLKDELILFMLQREVKAIRWMVGTQIAYFAITLSAVYFLLHFR